MAKKVTNLYTAMLSGLMAVLGFASCSDGDDDNSGGGGTVAMYGTPSATYKAEGTATDKGTGKAVADIRVVMADRYGDGNDGYIYYGLDTVYTDRNGKFALSGRGYGGGNKYVLFKDVDGAANGEYKEHEVELEYESSDFKGADGWYRGEATKNMGTVGLTAGRDETEE